MAIEKDVKLIKKIEDRVINKLKIKKDINDTGYNNDWYVQFENNTEKFSNYLFFSIYTEFQNDFEILKDAKNDLYYVMIHFENLNINDNKNADYIKQYCINNKLIEYKGNDFSHRDEWCWFAFAKDNSINNEITVNLNDLKRFKGTSSTLVDDLVKELERLYDVFF